jgi:hypothetical protein
MTTVTADSTTMASDSRAATTDVKTSVRKIWRVKGWLIGVAGDYSTAIDLISQLSESGESPFEYLRSREVKAKGVHLLLLSPSGKVYESDEGSTPCPLLEGFGAIGTGSQGAMVALHMGLSAADAVRAVKKVDPNTGGRVITRKI